MSVPPEQHGGYWPRPWTCEDGGPHRHGCAYGVPGLGIGADERLVVSAVAQAWATDALVRREPGELYALRHEMKLGGPQAGPVDSWVERLDSGTLAVVQSSPRLPGGPFWPGGIAAHRNGDLYVVFGEWAHRLSPALELLASHRLPVQRPHNSFVVLEGGEIVTKDCDAPAGLAPSVVSVLDPLTLMPLAAPLALPEPSIARLSCDRGHVIALGTERAFRLTWEAGEGRLSIEDAWQPAYGPAAGRSYGWDPVVAGEHVLWMDNGRNHTDRTMLGSGSSPDPLRLWWTRREEGAQARSLQVSGLPFGTVSNPPAWDPLGRIVVAYDAGNAVIAAFRLDGDELTRLWRRDGLAHAGHLIVFPDTRELVVGDWKDRGRPRSLRARRALALGGQLLVGSAAARRAALRTGADSLVVLDLDDGSEKARVQVPSPVQGFLFPAPGFARDIYYQSLSTIARVQVSG